MAFPTPFYRWRPHPWHGLEVGPSRPQLVHAYIEITPFDVEKYEIDIVAVLENDNIWGQVTKISDLPEILVERLCHDFMTYKLVPGMPSQFSIEKVYGCEEAFAVIAAAIEDDNEEIG